MIHCQCDRSCAVSVNFGGALTLEPSLARPLWVEHTRSTALVVGSGAPICGLSPVLFTNMTSCSASYAAFHSANCIQCDVAYTICLNLCAVFVFLLCRYTLMHVRTYTPRSTGIVCVCVCVCVPSSWFTAASTYVLTDLLHC